MFGITLLDLVYTIIIPALFAVTFTGTIIVWVFCPPAAKLLIKKRFGMLKNKAINLIGWDDRVLTLEAMDVTPEGMLEREAKKGRSKNFYLAKPQDNTSNRDQNIIDATRDLDILPAYSLDGIPVHFSHISKAIATNPRVLTALRYADRQATEKHGRLLKGKAITKNAFGDEGEVKNNFDVDVLLPFDPVDIKKNFPSYWQQSNIDSTKRRNQQIGMEKAKQTYMGMLKYVVILCALAVAVVAIVSVAMYFLTRPPEEPVVIAQATTNVLSKLTSYLHL